MTQRTIVLMACCAVLFANLTYIVGRFVHPADLTYTARDAVIGADKSVYISMIEEARQGSFLFQNLFTSESQHARFFHPLWLLLGNIAGVLSVSSLDVFEVSRLIAGFFFLLLLGNLSNRLFREKRWAFVAFFLFAFSSGMGALLLPSGRHLFIGPLITRLPVDLWQLEMHTFGTLMHSALFIVSQALLLCIFWLWTQWEERRGRKTFLFLLCATTLLTAVHPYDAVIVGGVIGLRSFFLFWSTRARVFLWSGLAVIVSAALAPLFLLRAIGSEIALAGWFAQNITRSLPIQYLIGYGFFLPLALSGFWFTKKEEGLWALLRLWVFVAVFFLFVPFQFQRRLMNGVHIPLVLFAVQGLRMLVYRWRKHPLLLAMSGWILVLGFFSSTFYLIGEEIFVLIDQGYIRHAPLVTVSETAINESAPLYIPSSTARAMEWIRDFTPRAAVVLAAPVNGNAIPAFTGRRVYAGHGHQTVNSLLKRDALYRYFFPRNHDDRAKQFFFRNEGIQYLLWTPFEQSLGKFSPDDKPYFREVYRNREARVYRFMTQGNETAEN